MHSKTAKILLRYDAYLDILEEYLNLEEFRNLSLLTISSKRVTITSFLNYLGDNKVMDFHHCLQKNVTGYLSSIANLSSSTISGRTFTLRHFFNYLSRRNLTLFSGYELFPVIFTNKRERILSFYSIEEVRRIISAIDRGTPYGKRDFIVLLLAAELGMRSGDIIRLKTSDIHWDHDTIEFVQYKTKTFNQLPLMENIKYALIDYLKNGRPESDSGYIFIGTKNGKKPLTNTCIHQIVSKYFRKANVDTSERKHGPHAMRHSLASNMLHNNTPMHVIKEVLGHSSINTTRIYLNIDVDSLRELALEVPYETV
ncbi:site-specific recombinase XerD [Desulfitobacterium dichloroeliminans LMG P-21439]|uniref:Site-specific recombinase XerD n=1 Tax=Desulfitobacterium dichloroeliminans (strain LMG P-21439 / DCA1) TaxID=871963 RepID=L0FCB5_DESDL|nr:site-specific integrase [Desulfitobacterium dichloroeliminans]AGA70573.1 site-specific recombinase XerD [Desulfitobacterium dichloroeliminans LMG P-21439]